MNKPSFHGKRVLFLQGPVGPFFWNLSKDMRSKGAEVYKFNFNAGDWIFFRAGASSFKGSLAEWPDVLEKFIKEKSIDVIILFGDCRPVHACVRGLAQELGCAVGVFEEGYLRPDYVTFEPVGVNGNSEFSQSLAPWLVQQALSNNSNNKINKDQIKKESNSIPVGNTYWHAAVWGMLYFFVSWFSQWFWNNTLHHRQMSVLDAPFWWLSYGRKLWYKIKEKGIEEKLCGDLRSRFFLIPLQVHNDSQITVHSDFDSVCNFADYVMRSFSKALVEEQKKILPKDGISISDTVLVFKHHPMDRGHRNYGKALKLLTRRYGLEGKIIYIHDQHLPALLKATRGVVLVNSTVGLSALQHGAPVKVCGTALYDMPGLTFQGRLRDFWHMSEQANPDAEELKRFKQALIRRTQLNGSFYKKLSQVEWQCGVALDGQMAERLWPVAVSAVQKPLPQSLKAPLLAPAEMPSDGVLFATSARSQRNFKEQHNLSMES